MGIAYLAFAKRQRAGAVERVSRRDQTRAGLGGLQETGFHFHRNAAFSAWVERPRRHRHRDIEQGQQHSAVRDRPAVHVPISQIESDGGAAIRGTDELHPEFLYERDLVPKCCRVGHMKPYPARAVCVNEWHNHPIMTASAAADLRIVALLFTTLLVGLPAAWTVPALWYQAAGGRRIKAMIIAVWIALSVGVLLALWRGWTALSLSVFAAAFTAVMIWWRRIQPSNDRLWADDVAQIAAATVDGDTVTLQNVRNFDWRSNTDYTPRWETRVYDLKQLNSIDMIMSYWRGPAIAHMLVSFGFAAGEHVAFSVEIRRGQRQSYSEIGGFFKEFGLSIIAADERDVICVRTNVRREDAYLYRIRMPLFAMRSLFLSYLGESNKLISTPRFYNTITANCTTLVYHMMTQIIGYLPLNYRILISGYFPAYVYAVGGLDRRFALDELRALGRITDRARRADGSSTFSADIRRGIPAIDPSSLPDARPNAAV